MTPWRCAAPTCWRNLTAHAVSPFTWRLGAWQRVALARLSLASGLAQRGRLRTQSPPGAAPLRPTPRGKRETETRIDIFILEPTSCRKDITFFIALYSLLKARELQRKEEINIDAFSVLPLIYVRTTMEKIYLIQSNEFRKEGTTVTRFPRKIIRSQFSSDIRKK